ncbi:hypothetical protein SB5439_04966 [Klebsiella variicola]|nr:hypothetical protein SB5439_04966 [Klebsiella variicola]
MCGHVGLTSGFIGLASILMYAFVYISNNPFYFFDLIFNLIPFVWLGCVIGLVIVGYTVEYKLGDATGGKRMRCLGWSLIGVWLLFFAYIEAIEYLV